MPLPSEREIISACTEQLGMSADLVVARCRFDYELDGFMGADGSRIALILPRSDGTLMCASHLLRDLSEISPSGIDAGGFALNIAVEGRVWHAGQIPHGAAERLVPLLEEAPGGRLLHEAHKEAHKGLEPTAEAAVDSGETLPDQEDWYLSVQGPAKQSYFYQEGDAAAAGKEAQEAQPQKAQPRPMEEPIEPEASTPRPVSQRSLAQKAMADPAFRAKIVKEDHQKMVAKWQAEQKESPDRIEPYRQLCRLYYQNGNVERAYWHAAVLSHFNVAELAERQIYERYRHTNLIYSGRRIPPAMWLGVLNHPHQDPWPGAVFAILSKAVGTMLGRSLRSYGLRYKERRDLATDKLLVSRVFRNVHDILDLTDMDFYVAPDSDSELMLANVVTKSGWRPCFVAGSRLLRDRTEQELAFIMARDLCYLRPEHMIALLLPSSGHQTLLMRGATLLVRPDLVEGDDMDAVDRQAQVLDDLLEKDDKQKLMDLVDEMADRQVSIDLERWNSAVQLTAHRVGLLVCQDLAVATSLLAREPPRAVVIPPEEQLRELMLFAVSESHFQAREELKIAWRP